MTDQLSALFSRWAAVFTARGVAALLEVVATEQELPARMLARTDGERQLTDLRHVGQALHAAALGGGARAARADRLAAPSARGRKGEISSDRVRRLDTDAAAAQVVTLHASKGLQYPVVYLPFAFDRYVFGHRTPCCCTTRGDGCWTSADPARSAGSGRPSRWPKTPGRRCGTCMWD